MIPKPKNKNNVKRGLLLQLSRPLWSRSGSSKSVAGDEKSCNNDERLMNLHNHEKHNSVQFNEDSNKIFSVIRRTQEESFLCWYNDSEYDDFRKDRVLTRMRYEQRIRFHFEETNFCIRGLEDQKKKLINQKAIQKQVLDEQRRQIDNGYYPPNSDLLRDVSLWISKESKHNAINIAKKDAKINKMQVVDDDDVSTSTSRSNSRQRGIYWLLGTKKNE